MIPGGCAGGERKTWYAAISPILYSSRCIRIHPTRKIRAIPASIATKTPLTPAIKVVLLDMVRTAIELHSDLHRTARVTRITKTLSGSPSFDTYAELAYSVR
jgi:hypothetical protein